MWVPVGNHAQRMLLFSDINQDWKLSTNFSENCQRKFSWKYFQLRRVDRQTNDDVINLAVTLGRTFPNAPKILPCAVNAVVKPSSRKHEMVLPYLKIFNFSLTNVQSGFAGLEDECWPLVPKFAGSNPAEAVGFFRETKSKARLPSEGK
jgi:hypothetical protein